MSAELVDCLQDIDTLVQRVAYVLNNAPGDELLNVCVDLQQATYRMQTLQSHLPASAQANPQLLLPLRKAAAALASVQENLARRAVLTQQTLQTLFPAARSDTYSVRLGLRTNQPYGSAGRRSGEFRVVAA